MRPLAGRLFTNDRDLGVVLSAALWRRRFGRDPAVIGQTVYIDSRAFVVRGMAPEGFSGTTWGVAADVWLPGITFRERKGEDAPDVVPFGRLRQGLDLERAQQQVDRIAPRIPLIDEPGTSVTGAALFGPVAC